MKKISSSLKNMILSLCLIGIFSAFIIGSVHQITEKPIAEAKNRAEADAIYKIIGMKADNNPFADKLKVKLKNSKSKLTVYPLKKDGLIKAFAIKSNSNKGFGGKLEILVGITIDGYILGYEVLKSQETPGLGTKVSEEKFKSQFVGLRPKEELKVKQDGGEIDAVTAATISSRAVTEAVQQAYDGYKKLSHRR